MEDPIDQVPVDAIGATVRTPGLVLEALYTFFSVVSTPTPQRAVRDTEDPTDLRRTNPSFQVLLDRSQTKMEIFSDQGHPFLGAAICVDNSGGQMSCYTTPSPCTGLGASCKQTLSPEPCSEQVGTSARDSGNPRKIEGGRRDVSVLQQGFQEGHPRNSTEQIGECTHDDDSVVDRLRSIHPSAGP